MALYVTSTSIAKIVSCKEKHKSAKVNPSGSLSFNFCLFTFFGFLRFLLSNY